MTSCEPSLRSRSSRWRGVVTTTLGCLLVFVSLPLIAGSFVELMQAKVEQARAARLALLPPPTSVDFRMPRVIVVRPSSIAATPQSPERALHWEYPLPLPRDVTFDVERAPTPTGPWTLIGTTNQPPYPINQPGFYRVGTHNL